MYMITHVMHSLLKFLIHSHTCNSQQLQFPIQHLLIFKLFVVDYCFFIAQVYVDVSDL